MQAIVFGDVTDPWSYLGAVRFERAAATFTILTGEPVEIVHRAALPVEQTPVEEAVRAARISGIDLNVDDVVAADSTDAWRVLVWANESGPAVQRDLVHQLWRAHFLEGADVADPLVLSLRAALVGLDAETCEALLASREYETAVEQQRAMARELGATDLPFVVVDGERTIEGLQSQDGYVDALGRIRREAEDSSDPS